ncbi:tRNA (N6-isopentenyl adenosine(37)-C2)-methylthiotransferase MiaB [bacterium]|nr:tRNA (N6-isopentenyl adenosine(37)-C2)-methylthiotransferase MiaB [bacterium]MBU4561414.1 tRNA (N6-isopentenyl adenosine(37)-C2)-methylthiotransferase MiaB [bacterium]MCG2676452.1 tRNA (N6-isopentenyl adenosine(37)-C2)-methylthiotransferase MiaB [bacterium]
MNVRDSEVITGLLMRQDYQAVTEEVEADIIIYNTCSVRQHAEDKVWSELGRFRERKSPSRTPNPESRKPIIGLVGCMAQNYKDEIFKRAPQVDFVVGPSDIHKIPGIIEKVTKPQGHRVTSRGLFESKIWETDGNIRLDDIYHTGFYKDKNHAYTVISEGCSNFCSYCVVPYVRGELKNRNYKDIIKEIEGAVDKGITNITLLGQNVCAYQYGDVNLVKLLKLVNPVKGLKEFSFVTSHPKDTVVDLFRAMRDLEKIKKYLHLPVQSGSNRILKDMNRGYTREEYLKIIDKVRSLIPRISITTDIIVGFPGEREEDFVDTLSLMEEVRFASAYMFKYSSRPGTLAERMLDQIPEEIKLKRLHKVIDLQRKMATAGAAKR